MTQRMAAALARPSRVVERAEDGPAAEGSGTSIADAVQRALLALYRADPKTSEPDSEGQLDASEPVTPTATQANPPDDTLVVSSASPARAGAIETMMLALARHAFAISSDAPAASSDARPTSATAPRDAVRNPLGKGDDTWDDARDATTDEGARAGRSQLEAAAARALVGTPAPLPGLRATGGDATAPGRRDDTRTFPRLAPASSPPRSGATRLAAPATSPTGADAAPHEPASSPRDSSVRAASARASSDATSSDAAPAGRALDAGVPSGAHPTDGPFEPAVQTAVRSVPSREGLDVTSRHTGATEVRGRRSSRKDGRDDAGSSTDRVAGASLESRIDAARDAVPAFSERPAPQSFVALAPAAESDAGASMAERAPVDAPVRFTDLDPTRARIEIAHPALGTLDVEVHSDAGHLDVALLTRSVAASIALRAAESGLRSELRGGSTELRSYRVRTESLARRLAARPESEDEEETES